MCELSTRPNDHNNIDTAALSVHDIIGSTVVLYCTALCDDNDDDDDVCSLFDWWWMVVAIFVLFLRPLRLVALERHKQSFSRKQGGEVMARRWSWRRCCNRSSPSLLITVERVTILLSLLLQYLLLVRQKYLLQ